MFATGVRILRRFACVLLLLIAAPAYADAVSPIRIGVTPVFLSYQTAFLEDWRKYLEARLHREISFVQRTTYREILDLLLKDRLEFAWICGYPFLRFQPHLRLLAVPIYQGEPYYRSYLIVPSSDTETQSIRNLRNKIFAYSDPDSNSGYLVPRNALLKIDEDPNLFFRKTLFTWAHEDVVNAVARRVADGGAVDGYIWDTLAKLNPDLTRQTRVVSKSVKFGFPPVVARSNVDEEGFAKMQEILLLMSRDPTGRDLLRRLNLDGFSRQDMTLYEPIGRMRVGSLER